MEYIAAMDFEVDHVVPAREPHISTLFSKQQSTISERDYDFFMDDDNREMTPASLLTELVPLPFLIRRNSSKRKTDDRWTDKENSLSRCPSLSKSYSIPRTISISDASREVLNSFRITEEPLQNIKLPRSCSRENSLILLKESEKDSYVKESIFCGNDDLKQTSLSSQVKNKQVREEGISLVNENMENGFNKSQNISQQESAQVEALSHEDITPMQSEELIQEESVGNISLPVNENLETSRVLRVPSPEQECDSTDESRSSSLMHAAEALTSSISPSQSQHWEVSSHLQIHTSEHQSKMGDDISSQQDDVQVDASVHYTSNNEVEHVQTDSTCNQESENIFDPISEVGVAEDSVISENPAAENVTPRFSSPQRNDNQLQFSSVPSETNNKRTRSPSPDQDVTPKKLSKSFVDKIPVIDDEEDVSSLFRKGNYVRIVLNSIFRANNSPSPSVISDAAQTPPAHFSHSSDTESQTKKLSVSIPKQLIVSGATKRKSVSPSVDSPASKMSRKECQTPRKTSMITRRSCAKLQRQSPNHSAYYISQKKVQIFKAAEEGDLEVVRKLLHHTGPGITIGKNNCTLLHTAAANNQCDVVLHLLKIINPNVVNREGQTPAYLAATKGHTQILKILLSDKEFNPDKLDKKKNTFRDLLVGPLFEAVLVGDRRRTQVLLQLGANPDHHAGKLVEGTLARELQVTTPRQLAVALHGEHFLNIFSEPWTPLCSMASTNEQTVGPNSNMEDGRKGYVCVLNFKSFIGRPALDRGTSTTDASHLVRLFENMGYSGNSHTSMTAEETRQTIMAIRDSPALDEAECAIFVISSHGINRESFLTSDMKVLTTEWVMSMFKDSECPQLKNKPKLFIFDFNSGPYMEGINLRPEEKVVRVEEPFNDMICLSSQNIRVTSEGLQGRSFLRILCQVLRQHDSNKDILDFYQELQKKYQEVNCGSLPELQNFGLSRKFYLHR